MHMGTGKYLETCFPEGPVAAGGVDE